MISGTLALAFAAAFTGASFYVNWVEQPARLKLDDAALLSEWGPSDSRGVLLLVALAAIIREALWWPTTGFAFVNVGRSVVIEAIDAHGCPTDEAILLRRQCFETASRQTGEGTLRLGDRLPPH